MDLQVPSGEVTPIFGSDSRLTGFYLPAPLPSTTTEWTLVLAAVVSISASPGRLLNTCVFSPDSSYSAQGGHEHVFPLVGTVNGNNALGPGSLASPAPDAAFLIHPPEHTQPSTPETEGAASGAVLLPGVPQLGLTHRAGWAEVSHQGSVTKLLSSTNVDVTTDVDLAVLEALCSPSY